VGFFTEEEGVRFGVDMLGSSVTAGRLTLDYAHKLTDDDGASVADELVRTGFDGPVPERRPIPYAYIECHIEQGPILAAAGVDVGIVTGVQSISWQRLELHGEASHAGATPIEHRKDAGVAAAAVILEIRRMCESGEFGQLRGTVGKLSMEPGSTNVVPSGVRMTIDLRNPDDAAMTAAEAHLAEFVAGLAGRHGVAGGPGADGQDAGAGVRPRRPVAAGGHGGRPGAAVRDHDVRGRARRAGDRGDLPDGDGVRGRRVRRDQPHAARVLEPDRLRQRRRLARERHLPPRQPAGRLT
jgi:hypothetical protein